MRFARRARVYVAAIPVPSRINDAGSGTGSGPTGPVGSAVKLAIQMMPSSLEALGWSSQLIRNRVLQYPYPVRVIRGFVMKP